MKYILKPKDNLNNILAPIEQDLKELETLLKKSLLSENYYLDELIKYVINSGGKRLRPALVFLFAKALNKGAVSEQHCALAQASEMIHTASLIHDDVIDEADIRRGLLTVGKKWNYKTAVISGDFILARALMQLVFVGNTVTEIFAKTINDLCIGEIQQGNQNYKIISFEDYIEKSTRKTAKLFVACSHSVAVSSSGITEKEINASKEYALNFGIAFQIIDDVLNFSQSKKEIGKPAGNDLKNGILTAPVLYALEEYEEKKDSTLKNLITNKIQKEKYFELALNLILNTQGIEKSKQLAQNYVNKAIKSLEVLEDSVYKQALIDFAVYNIERKL